MSDKISNGQKTLLPVYGFLGKTLEMINGDKVNQLNNSVSGMAKLSKNLSYITRHCKLKGATFDESVVETRKGLIVQNKEVPPVKFAKFKDKQISYIYDGLITFKAVNELLRGCDSDEGSEKLKTLYVPIQVDNFESEVALIDYMTNNLDLISDALVQSINESVPAALKAERLFAMGENSLPSNDHRVVGNLSDNELSSFKDKLSTVASRITGVEIHRSDVDVIAEKISRHELLVGFGDANSMTIKVKGVMMLRYIDGLSSRQFYEHFMGNTTSPYYQPLSAMEATSFALSAESFREQFEAMYAN